MAPPGRGAEFHRLCDGQSHGNTEMCPLQYEILEGELEYCCPDELLGMDSDVNNKERLDSLESRIYTLESSAGISSESDSSRTRKWTAWLPIGAPIATLISALIATVLGVGVHLDNKIGAVQRDNQANGLRVGKLEDSVKVIANQQSDQTQKLIHDLLSIAKNPKQPETAARAIQAATSLISSLKDKRRSSSPEFFESAIQEIYLLHSSKHPDLQAAVFTAQKQLAEYRSALNPIPQLDAIHFKTMDHAFFFPLSARPSVIEGGAFDVRQVKGNAVHLEFPGKISTDDLVVNGSVFLGGIQSLDGIRWHNVTFINMHIAYGGGEVELHNVNFINCTFDLPNNGNGSRLSNYAALKAEDLRIGS